MRRVLRRYVDEASRLVDLLQATRRAALSSVPLLALLLLPASVTAKDWGIYQIYWNPAQFEKGLDQQLEQLGGTPTYALFFRDLNPRRGFPQQAVETCRERGLTPIISLELWEWQRSRNGGGLQEIVEGRHDGFFRDWARDARKWGHPCILRFGFEMNGDWFSWGGQPELFRKAWRHAHRLFDEADADNVQWMFAPNVIFDTSKPLVDFDLYYPGSDQVDLVGLDGYNFGDDHDRWHTWSSCVDVFDASVTKAAGWGKPILLSEVGCADDPRKGDWMMHFLEWVRQRDEIAGYVYFNYNKTREGEPNWRLDSDPDTLRAFREKRQ